MYNAYQSAQPQTLAYALQDSPAGWLAWVTQLFQRFVELEYILVNASTYWLTNSPARLSAATTRRRTPSTVPRTRRRRPGSRSSRTTSSRSDALPNATATSSAGTVTTAAAILAHDAPELLLDDIRQFFRALR